MQAVSGALKVAYADQVHIARSHAPGEIAVRDAIRGVSITTWSLV